MLEWKKIETVLLDMDGTLLDLNFDNHFWKEFVPLRYAQQHGLSQEEAKKSLLGEKQPSMQFVTTEQLAGLALFFCSPAADQVRGVAWNMDGGWFAQ